MSEVEWNVMGILSLVDNQWYLRAEQRRKFEEE